MKRQYRTALIQDKSDKIPAITKGEESSRTIKPFKFI